MTPEEAVIGACLLDQNVIREAVQFVMPSDFATWQGEEVFAAIIRLHAMKKPVDVLTVTDELGRARSRVDPAQLHYIVGQVPSASNVSYYAEMVREAATRRALTRTGQKLVQYANDQAAMPGMVLATALEELKAAREDASMTSLRGTTMGELMAVEDTWDWVIKGLFEVQDRLIITGDPGAGKSYLTIQMAVFAAAGIHPFWLTPIPPVDVVVMDYENSKLQYRRKSRKVYEAAKQLGTADPGRFYIEHNVGEVDITRSGDLGYIHRVLDQNPCQILFLGPLYRLVPRAMNTDDEAAKCLNAINSLRERGCAVVTEAHAGHNSADLHPRGSSAFMGWPEFGFGLRRDPNVQGRFDLARWRGDREGRSFPLNMSWGSGNVPWVPDGVSQLHLGRLNDPGAMFHENEEGRAIGY